jgi:hypothetical protein
MKTATQMAAQGDVLFRRVECIPSDCRPVPTIGALVVAHSETGHHHVIRSPDVVLYENSSPWICYLRLEGPFADVEHLRPHDTHETVRLLGASDAPTFFEVRRQREHVPVPAPNGAAWRSVAD